MQLFVTENIFYLGPPGGPLDGTPCGTGLIIFDIEPEKRNKIKSKNKNKTR